MQITILKSKLHRATVTHAALDYEGSLAIDSVLMKTANIIPFEQLHVYNVSNGERFTTYAIKGEANSGVIGVNGAAAHKAAPNDILIICTYAVMPKPEAVHFSPVLVYLLAKNTISHQTLGVLGMGIK
ncbi:MAG: aspartate 1-decarboxylase [Mariprofundaceae bacterium]|nr:aspartate 1-decarboxylase [Mariprofundaceae bacterium]